MRIPGDTSRHELIRFQRPSSVDDWSAIDDAIMGGVSQSHLRHEQAGYAVFEGQVSLANNGGFASIRSRPLELGYPQAAAYLLDVRGDGKPYKFNLRTDDAFDGINYQATFLPPAGAWSLVRIEVGALRATFRGRTLPDVPALDSSRVRQIGLMTAAREAGPFALALRSIQVE